MFKIPDNKTQNKLTKWQQFRRELVVSETPLDDVVKYFDQFTTVKLYTDPYDQNTWPTAWELIEENQYCTFNKLLGICYTLQLADLVGLKLPIITISIDSNSNSVYYLLNVNHKIYGFSDGHWISENLLPKSIKHIKVYQMPDLS